MNTLQTAPIINDPTEWALRSTFVWKIKHLPEQWACQTTDPDTLEAGDDIGIVLGTFAAHLEAVAAGATSPTVNPAALALGTYLHKRLTIPEKHTVTFLAALLSPAGSTEDIHTFFVRQYPDVPEVSRRPNRTEEADTRPHDHHRRRNGHPA